MILNQHKTPEIIVFYNDKYLKSHYGYCYPASESTYVSYTEIGSSGQTGDTAQ